MHIGATADPQLVRRLVGPGTLVIVDPGGRHGSAGAGKTFTLKELARVVGADPPVRGLRELVARAALGAAAGRL